MYKDNRTLLLLYPFIVYRYHIHIIIYISFYHLSPVKTLCIYVYCIYFKVVAWPWVIYYKKFKNKWFTQGSIKHTILEQDTVRRLETPEISMIGRAVCYSFSGNLLTFYLYQRLKTKNVDFLQWLNIFLWLQFIKLCKLSF